MKRKLLALALLVICLSLAVGGTLAYFTKDAIAHNIITTGDINIELLEWADEEKTEPFPEEGVSGVMPGASVTKIVEVKNTGSGAAYVRIKAEKAIELANAAPVAGADTSLITLNINTEKWTQQGEYYYYNTALAPGATTEPLFTSVGFAASMGNAYQNCVASVDVTAQAVQAANNGTSPLTAAGWPA